MSFCQRIKTIFAPAKLPHPRIQATTHVYTNADGGYMERYCESHTLGEMLSLALPCFFESFVIILFSLRFSSKNLLAPILFFYSARKTAGSRFLLIAHCKLDHKKLCLNCIRIRRFKTCRTWFIITRTLVAIHYNYRYETKQSMNIDRLIKDKRYVWLN